MNFPVFIFFFLFIYEYYHGDCATLETSERMKDNIQREESLLATGVSDKTRNRKSHDQSKEKYLDVIAEDHGRALDNLVEFQDGSLEQTVKEKRCKPLDSNFVGLQRNSNVNLPLFRRETTSSLLRRTCDNCMSAPMCKTKGKCDSCKKLCDRYEASLDQRSQDMQMDEPISIQNPHRADAVGISSRLSNSDEDQGGLSYGDDRYYTVGSFGKGPVHKLLAKLLNIKDTGYLEQLLILAKTKSRKDTKSIHPVVIDTAHVFTLNNGGPSKLDVELHKVSGTTANAETIATELDKEITKAMEDKRRKTSTPFLTPKEIDDIILNKMGENSKNDSSQDGRNIIEEQNKNETVACTDQKEDAADKEEVYVPYGHHMRENDEDRDISSHSQDLTNRKATSEDNISKNEMQIVNRLYTMDNRDHLPDHLQDNANNGKFNVNQEPPTHSTNLKPLNARERIYNNVNAGPTFEQKDIKSNPRKMNYDNTQLNIVQSAPIQQGQPVRTTTEEPTTLFKPPKPANTKGADTPKKKNETDTPKQEQLQVTTPSGAVVLTTKHFDWPHGPDGSEISKSRSSSLDLNKPHPQNSPEIALQPQYDGEKYAPTNTYLPTHSTNLKPLNARERVYNNVNADPTFEQKDIKSNPRKMNYDNTQLNIVQSAPIQQGQPVRTTTEEPTTLFKPPKPANTKGADTPKKKNETDTPKQEQLQVTTPSGAVVLTTKHFDWPHGPDGSEISKSRSSSLDLNKPHPQNSPEIALQPQYDGEKYAPTNTYLPTHSTNLKQLNARERIYNNLNADPTFEQKDTESNPRKMNYDNTQLNIVQSAPIQQGQPVRTTTEEPTTLFKPPKPANTKGADTPKKKNETDTPKQEQLQVTTPSGAVVLTTKHFDWPHGPDGSEISKSRSSSLDLNKPHPQNSPEIALQPQYDSEKYAPTNTYLPTHSTNLKQLNARERIYNNLNADPTFEQKDTESNPRKMNYDNTQLNIVQSAPIQQGQPVRTTTEEPTTLFKPPKPANTKGADTPKKKNETDTPKQEQLQVTTPSGAVVLTTKHFDWPHGPDGSEISKSRSSSLDLNEPHPQNPPEIALQPQYDGEKYAPTNTYLPTHSTNLKQLNARERIYNNLNADPTFEQKDTESNPRKMNYDNTQLNIVQSAPIQQGQPVRTTTEEPTTLFKPPKPANTKGADTPKKKNETDTPKQEQLQVTTPSGAVVLTTKHFDWPHGPDGSEISKSRSSSLDLQNQNERNQEPMEETDNPTTGFVEKKMFEPTLRKEMYEDKYNKLKQWVMENVEGRTPILDSGENYNHLGDEIKGIVNSATKINDEISNIVQQKSRDPNLLQMVRENDQKLKDLDDNRKTYSIRLPNMNEFRTRLAPEQERKINEIFESPGPMARDRMNNDPYDFHPRRVSQYKNGEWAYEKIKPNRPPYPIMDKIPHPAKYEQYKEQVGETQSNLDTAPFVDSQLMDMDSIVDSLKEMPHMPHEKANKVVSIVEPESNDNALNTARSNAEKKLNQKNEQSERDRELQTDSNADTMQNIPETIRKDKEDNNETVACSKEEEEEINRILHFLPASRSGGRSSEHQESNLHALHKTLSDKPDNEYRAQFSTKATTDMIDSLNKMHKHGITTHPKQDRNFQSTNDENQRSFMRPIDRPVEMEQYDFYPSEQSQRYAMPMFSDSMRMNEDLPPNKMEPSFMEQQMMFDKANAMDQEIGSPLMQNDLKESLQQHSTHLGQDKHRNMFFVGDGIRLPLNMKEHNDGSLHLSVDIKTLCDCKHCVAKQLENNTIILEAVPLSEKEKLDRANTIDDTTENVQEMNINISQNEHAPTEFSSEEIDTEYPKVESKHEHDKNYRSKRSPQDNEIDADFSKIEDDVPLKALSREEIWNRLTKTRDPNDESRNKYETSTNPVNDQNDADIKRPVYYETRVFGSVIDFLKSIAMDMHREHS